MQVGLATAEELTRQKEQLMLTEQRLDDINSTLRNSEKHIQARLVARIHMFLGLPDPVLLVRGTDPAPDPDLSIIKQK